MFKHILVPLDQSKLVERELKAAAAMASATDAQVHVLRIRTEAADLDDAELDLDIIERETRTLKATSVAALTPHVPAERVHAEIRTGPLVATITAAAAEIGADLIVVGSHGRHGALQHLTGSTAERLVDKTAASVLVVKPEGFPFLKE